METVMDSSVQNEHRGQHTVNTKPPRLLRRSRTFQTLPLNKTSPISKLSEQSPQLELPPDKAGIRPQSCIAQERHRDCVSAVTRPNTSRSFHLKSGLPAGSSSKKSELRRLGSDGSLLSNKYQTGRGERRGHSTSTNTGKRTGSSTSITLTRSSSRNSSTGSIDMARSRSGSRRKVSGLVKVNGSLTEEIPDDNDEKERKERLRAKFCHAVRLVKIFSTFCIGIKRYAQQEKSTQYDLYYLRDMLPSNDDKPTPVQEPSLCFNKHLYSRDNTLHFPLWARWTCAQVPEDRSEADINKLVTLLRGMKSFNKFSREAQKNLCRTMSYARYERRRIIVRQGHPGFCFYFIVSGTVSVTVTRRDLKTGVSVTSTVDVLEKNDAFGEIALMTEDARRTATIICRERVEVLIVNRETVLEYCPDVFQREYQEKFDVLKSHELFKRWDDKALEQLCFESHIKELSHGKLVDADSTSSEAIYFIIRGKVEMLRRVDICAVLASNASINLCDSRPLPRPASSMPRRGRPKIEYVNVGSLYDKDSWDLRTLFATPPDKPGNILVSAGVRLLKVPKQRVISLSLKGEIEEFEKTFVLQHRCPSSEELYQEYLAAQSWLEYRQKVVANVLDYKRGRFVTHVSCSAKGTSGWGSWPGRQIKDLDRSDKCPDTKILEQK